MHGSAIRHLAASDVPSIVAAALFRRTVQIWSLETQSQLGEFESVLDFGGRRLALAQDGTICIAGSWTQGLAAYAVPDGRILWQRKDIRKIQNVNMSASGQIVFCGVESNCVLALDVRTGSEVSKLARALEVIPSQYGPHELVVKRDRYLIRGRDDIEIPAASFALHTAAFSPDRLCLSEPRAGSRCISIQTGETLWRHGSIHFNHAAFDCSDQQFYCVAGFETDPYEAFLVRLASELERCDVLVAFGRKCWTEAFTPSGRFVVTASGEVYETSTGTLRARLKFPEREYPDT